MNNLMKKRGEYGMSEIVESCMNNADNPFIDSVGGMHDGGIGWNPNGVWCGECCKGTCSGCVNEHKTEEIRL